jgi:hypothetical protein
VNQPLFNEIDILETIETLRAGDARNAQHIAKMAFIPFQQIRIPAPAGALVIIISLYAGVARSPVGKI